jgi:hypothetical protein
MIDGRLTVWIGEREALPVRAIPFVAGEGHSADQVAEYLAHFNGLKGKPRFPSLRAYQWRKNTVLPILPGDFERMVWRIRALAERLMREHPKVGGDVQNSEDAPPNPEGAAKFDDVSYRDLPTGVFVWLDDFLQVYRRERKGEGLRFQPLIDAVVFTAILEGFENCPSRPLHSDDWMVDYPTFLTLCRGANPNGFEDYRVETTGLFSKTPELEWGGDAFHEKPVLALPCNLGELRSFMENDGLHECIDEDVVRGLMLIAKPIDQSGGLLANKEEKSTNKPSPWWQTEYDILDLAQDFGDQLVKDGKRPSQNAVTKKLVHHINSKEERKTPLGQKSREISDTPLKKGLLRGWKHKPQN